MAWFLSLIAAILGLLGGAQASPVVPTPSPAPVVVRAVATPEPTAAPTPCPGDDSGGPSDGDFDDVPPCGPGGDTVSDCMWRGQQAYPNDQSMWVFCGGPNPDATPTP